MINMKWKTDSREWERLNTVLRLWSSHRKYDGLKSNAPRRTSGGRGYTARDCFDLVEGEINNSTEPKLYKKLLRGYLTLGDFQDHFLSSADKEKRDEACTLIWRVIVRTERV